LPKPRSKGRPRAWPMREIVNGIFYVMRAGCPVSEARPDNALLNIQRAAVGSGSGGEGLQYLADKLLISPDELVKLVFGLVTLGLPSSSGGAKRPSTKPKIACGDIAELCTKVR
jgi:hypothetical protein